MGDRTGIQWTDASWNPTLGCNRVSPGCVHCYAEVMASRIANAAQAALRAGKTLTPTQEAYRKVVRWERGKKAPADESDKALPAWNGNIAVVPEKLGEPLRWQRSRRIFVNSMSDLFHERLAFEDIAAVFGVMAAAAQHTFQVLTKRPERALAFFAWLEGVGTTTSMAERCGGFAYMRNGDAPKIDGYRGVAWPLPNVWLGVSAENQETADLRIPLLLQCPAAVRFVSYEPALGPVDFRLWINEGELVANPGPEIRWIIVGGESGRQARPFDVAWARSTVEQCREAGVACFVKQVGRWVVGDHAGFGTVQRWLLDDGGIYVPPLIGPRAFARPLNAIGFSLTNSHGGDWNDWPAELRVRQFPAALAAEGKP